MSAPLVVNQRTRHDDELNHIVCCDDNRSLCGLDMTEVPWCDDDENECVVCLDLEGLPCCEGCDW